MHLFCNRREICFAWLTRVFAPGFWPGGKLWWEFTTGYHTGYPLKRRETGGANNSVTRRQSQFYDIA